MKFFSLLGGAAAIALFVPLTYLSAQSFPPGTATIAVPPPTNSPADRLADSLINMSRNPKDASALIDAGRSAIAVGDYSAAISFLSRAEELAPSNGRVKAALGSALVMVEQPVEALRLFNEAVALGAPESEIAGDRGLAFDLQGQNRRAQRDYELALRYRNDDEVVRRLALSLGIAGDREAALRLLDPLLRRQDETGWRARAFVLAMNGGIREAESIATTIMPAGMGDTMRPFLRRLASLNAVDKAHAVNFGTMPADPNRTASTDGSRLIPAPELAPPSQEVLPPVAGAVVSSKAPRRRPDKSGVVPSTNQTAASSTIAPVGPGFSEIFQKSAVPNPDQKPAPTAVAPVTTPTRVGGKIGPVDRGRLPPELTTPPATMALPPPVKVAVATPEAFNRPGDLFPSDRPAVTTAAPSVVPSPEPEEIDQPANAIFEVPPFVGGKPESSVPTPVSNQPAKPAAAPSTIAGSSGPASVIVGAAPAGATRPAAGSQTALVNSTPARPPAAAQADTPPQQPFAQPSRGLLGLLEGIETEPESQGVALPSETEIKLAKLAAQRKAADAANRIKAEKEKAEKAEKAKADKEAAEAASRAKRNPARTWVQVATGANEAGLGITWRRLREKAPDALKGLSASYTPFKATNRILVGPFKSGSEARAVVNALSKAGVSSNMFSSEAGQEITKIAAK